MSRELYRSLLPPSGAEPELITVAAAAALLGRPARTVRYWCARGALPARRVGRDYVITRADLARFRQTEGI